MEQHNSNAGVIKNYTLTALLSFSIIFFLFAAFSKCSGPYMKETCSKHNTEHKTEHNTEHKTEAAHH